MHIPSPLSTPLLTPLLTPPPSSQSLVAFPKIKRQVLLCEPAVKSAKEFAEGSTFSINQEFGLV